MEIQPRTTEPEDAVSRVAFLMARPDWLLLAPALHAVISALEASPKPARALQAVDVRVTATRVLRRRQEIARMDDLD